VQGGRPGECTPFLDPSLAGSRVAHQVCARRVRHNGVIVNKLDRLSGSVVDCADLQALGQRMATGT
jgi:hypothetical protein